MRGGWPAAEREKIRAMKYRNSGALSAALFAVVLATPSGGRAETSDALARTALTAPGKSGTVQAFATATVQNAIMVEYVSPMILGTVDTGDGKVTLGLVSAGKASGRKGAARSDPGVAASVEVQGMPNQTFAISIDQAARLDSVSYVATFSHNAGQTPHIGPNGDTEFNIGAAFKVARNVASHGYNGALDLIVSHN
jgi:hypothetical protein